MSAGTDRQKRTTSGIPGLDSILEGGFPSNRLYLIQGRPGTGKTTFGLQFALEGARRGEPSLYVALTETEDEVRDSARSHGWNLEGVDLVHIGSANIPEARQTMLHSSDVALPKVTEALLRAIEENQPKRLVIDSLTEIRILARDNLWYREQLMLIKEHLSGRDCTALVLNDVGRKSEDTDCDVQSITSGVIELQRDTLPFGSSRRRINVLKIRGSRHQTGFHDFALDTGGIRVCPRLVASEHRRRFEPRLLSSGVDALDVLVGGGLDEGTSTLLLGPSGVGKSVVATQYVVSAAEQGQRSAIYLFDESEQTLFERSKKMGHDVEALVDQGMVMVLPIDPGHLSPGQFSQLVRDAVSDRGARVIVIDSLGGYHAAMREKAEHLTLYLHELLTYLQHRAVSSFLISTQHGLFGTYEHPSFELSYIANNVLLFRYFEFRGEVHQALSVFKRRTGNHERAIRELQLTADGVHIGDPLTKFRGVLTGVPEFIGEELGRPR